jgi:hypothetical protein
MQDEWGCADRLFGKLVSILYDIILLRDAPKINELCLNSAKFMCQLSPEMQVIDISKHSLKLT